VEDRLSLEELAQSVNISTTRLRALFKSETGMTPSQYVKKLKIEKAKRLAENTHLTISEILDQIGVGDESHFLRNFKRACGMTLTEYRNLHHKHIEEEV